jgi:hypothetical protein
MIGIRIKYIVKLYKKQTKKEKDEKEKEKEKVTATATATATDLHTIITRKF